jgi:hypothetical protein
LLWCRGCLLRGAGCHSQHSAYSESLRLRANGRRAVVIGTGTLQLQGWHHPKLPKARRILLHFAHTTSTQAAVQGPAEESPSITTGQECAREDPLGCSRVGSRLHCQVRWTCSDGQAPLVEPPVELGLVPATRGPAQCRTKGTDQYYLIPACSQAHSVAAAVWRLLPPGH